MCKICSIYTLYIIINIGSSFSELEKMYRRVLIIPVSSATAKISFLTTRRIKTYNRSIIRPENDYITYSSETPTNPTNIT